MVADAGSPFWLRHGGEGGGIDSRPLPEGLSMLTAGEIDDPESERLQTFLPRFRAAPAPRPEAGDWTGWEALLAARAGVPGGDPMAAMTVAGGGGFGTVSSSLMALPAPDSLGFRPIWRFAPGPPDEAGWEAITLTPEGL